MSKKNFGKKILSMLLCVALMLSVGMMTFAAGAYDSTEQAAISAAKATEVESEGIVLLKNNAYTGTTKSLPITASTKVNVFGTASIAPFYDGGGSGATNASSRRVSFYAALQAAGIQYNTALYDYYSSWYSANSTGSNEGAAQSRAEVPFATLSAAPEYQAAINDASIDTAIVFIGRAGSEFNDTVYASAKLKASEEAMIKDVGAHHRNVIVVFNNCQVMETGFLDDAQYNIDSAMYVWAPGDFGFTAVAKTLNGQYNPSGRLSTTAVYDITTNPAFVNFGDFTYTGTFGTNGVGAGSQNKYLEYEEGIYLGYRYYETFKPEQVQYHFGYGLSYTTFQWSNYLQSMIGDKVTVKVDVRNSGAVAGKDVVEIYVEQPYTTGGIEKAKRVLAGYAKTSLLAPGATETVTIGFNLYDIASYDMANGRYITEKGEYKIYASTDASEAGKKLNGSFTLANDRVFATDPTTGTAISNQFADAKGDLTVLSRANPTATYPTAPTSRTLPTGFTPEMIDAAPAAVTTGTAFPFGTTLATTITLQDIYAYAEAAVAANPDLSMDDALWNYPQWNQFLSQFTFAEAADIIGKAGYKTNGLARLGVPATADNDGPQQIKGTGATANVSGTAMPIGTAAACTWNDALVEEMGECIGADGNLCGVNVWYAPAMNLHRTHISGRNFEYYSEDPLLSGKMAAATTRGVQSKHVVVTLKHFALNDCETNRMGVATWADEQSIRELYLKPFEIGVKEANAYGIMSSFNRLGITWAGASKALLTNVLRNEWGFRGSVVTDFFLGGYMKADLSVYAQNDVMLAGAEGWINGTGALTARYALDPIGLSNAAAVSMKNVCYMKMRTTHFAGNETGTVEPPAPIDTLNGTFKWEITGYDWGPGVSKLIINTGDVKVNNSDLTDGAGSDYFQVQLTSEQMFGNPRTTNRTVTNVYVCDEKGDPMVLPNNYIAIDLKCTQSEGNPFVYKFMTSGLNEWANPYTMKVTLKKPIGQYGFVNFTDGGKYTPEADKFDRSGTFTKYDKTLSYASYAPDADDKRNPLVIWLHGAGEGGTDPYVTLYGNKVVNLASDDIQECFDGAYVLTPQAPTMWMDMGNKVYTNNGSSIYTKTLMALIKEYVNANPDIDPTRIYLGGCSNGGFMTINMLVNYPGYFAAAYPICEAYTTSWVTDAQVQSMINTPIWFTHNTADPTVNYRNTTASLFDRLIAAGAKNAHVAEFPNVVYNGETFNGHWSWIYTLNNAAPCSANASTILNHDCTGGCEGVTVMDWLAAQAKPNTGVSVATGGTVIVPITLNAMSQVAGVRGVLAYDDSLLELQSITAAKGFNLVSDPESGTFVLVTGDGAGVDGSKVVGYAIFTAKADLLDDVTTAVTFPTLTATGADLKESEAFASSVDVTIEGIPPMPGDVNGSEAVDVADAIMLMQYLAGSRTLTPRQLKAADVNKDGKVNVGDVTIIMQMCL